ncbi:CrcB family protein [Sporosarcina sp. HYO08]|uniref:fluoride efflux transporter FluC n=1 Tax=Sporosarcina sp. HYO08 TaxID=1759557 RepID=UPI00079948B5|nr:CrcB family protein [Sporosarcina sp. HYO08]KXH86892.1 hypothetical protein AU377_13750 [Sporosarcina sp. HYO08]
MKKYFVIGSAGALGAVCRTMIGQAFPSHSGFPAATLAINIVGAFVLCLIVAGAIRTLKPDNPYYEAVTTGFLGAFTTFSTLSWETVTLIQNEQLVLATSYVLLSIFGGLAAGAIGFRLGGKQVRI